MSLELTRRVASAQGWLDILADKAQPLIQSLLEKQPRLREALDGRWAGVPLHPALTDVPIGAWTTAAVLDSVDRDGRATDAVLAIGVLGALPAAVTGLSDWSHLQGEQRRVGALHATMNGVALVLNVASLLVRARGKRGAGRTLSRLGFAVAGLSAHVGGELSFGLGVRVNRTAFEAPSEESLAELPESELDDGAMRRVEVDGVPVLVARATDGRLCAIAATCSHLGGPLDEGERDGDVVVCPWHRSRFELCTGEVLASPAVFPQPRYRVTASGGNVTVQGA